MKKSTIYTVFFLMLLMLLFTTYMGGRMREMDQPFDIGDYSGADPAAAEQAFLDSDSNESLIEMLKVLCYRYKIEGDETVIPKIRRYGQELLDRARVETVDLEKMDENGEILQILSVIRGTGAR